MQTVVETLTYLKAASTLFTEAERADIVAAIASDPEAGDLMPGTGDIANGDSDGQEWGSEEAHESYTSMAAEIFPSSSSPFTRRQRRET